MSLGDFYNQQTRKRSWKWTREQEQYLVEHYPYDSWDLLLDHLPGETKESLAQKAHALRIRRDIAFWSENDIAVLTKAYEQKIPVDEIVVLLGEKYAKSAILTKANKLGLHQREKWSDSDKEKLLLHYENTPTEDLMRMFPGKKLVNVQNKARALGLHSFTYLSRKWEPHEDTYIKDNWENVSDSEMASALGRTFRAVKWRRELLGLIREVPDGSYEYLRKYLWRANKEWRKKSIAACGHKCIITGGRFDAVHHLHSSNLIVQETLDTLGLDYQKVCDYSDDELAKISEKYAEVNMK